MDSEHGTEPADPLVTRARALAAGHAAASLAVAALVMRRPGWFRSLFGFQEGGDDFYARWGFQVLAYVPVSLTAALFPSAATFGACAAIVAVEAPADTSAWLRTRGWRRALHAAGAVYNTSLLAVFLLAAQRARTR